MKSSQFNLVKILEESAEKFPSRISLVFGSKKISYSRLLQNSSKLASGLKSLGVKAQDKVAIWLPNCPEFVYAFFAALRLGAVIVPINTMLKREEALYMIDDCKAKTLICSIDKSEDSQNIASRLNVLGQIISLPVPINQSGFLNFYSLINENEELKEIYEVEDDSLAEIVYTSGTTGKPKGACLSHKNLSSNIKDCAKAIRFSKRDCLLCILPLFHSFSSTVCMLLPLSKGAKIIIMRSVRPFKRVVRSIFKNKVSIFVGVPSLYNILSEIKISKWQSIFNLFMNPIRLCISGAAALPYDVWQRFERKIKRPLLQGYGLTEASPVVSLNPLGKRRKPGSIGIALSSVEVKIEPRDKRDQIGELLVKGPNVMLGYYNLPEANKETLKDGWLHTGDLAKIDKDGFIYIIGRSKEMINVRGFNVYPREIEDLIYKYPETSEAAVVGVLHKHRGEVPVAFVVANRSIKQRELIDYLRANLASYKVPLKIFFKDSLPKNSTGKILKRELQEEIKNIFL